MKPPRLRFVVVFAIVAVAWWYRRNPPPTPAELAREKIETLQRVKAYQNAIVDVYIQQLSKQTNE
jgi:hypothetical protein